MGPAAPWPAPPPPQRTPWTLVVLYASTCAFINRVSAVLNEHVYRQTTSCDFCNDHYDESWRTSTQHMSSLACINKVGKMIHNFCYSHLIMINTLYTCTVQVRVQYTVQCTQYKVYYYFLLGSILLGGGGLKPTKP